MMDERCDGRSNFFGNLNLKRFSVATWNIRSLKPKIEDVADILERKAVDICSFQETKMDNLDEVWQNHRFICHDRGKENMHYGMGFAIWKELEVYRLEKVSDRISLLTLRKRQKWESKNLAPLKKKIYQPDKKNSELTILNAYAPHMGITTKTPENTEKFYGDLQKVITSLK